MLTWRRTGQKIITKISKNVLKSKILNVYDKLQNIYLLEIHCQLFIEHIEIQSYFIDVDDEFEYTSISGNSWDWNQNML